MWGSKRNDETGVTTYQWFEGDEVGEEFTKVTQFEVEGRINGKLVQLRLNPDGPNSFFKNALIALTAAKFIYSSDDFFVKGYGIREIETPKGGIDMMPNQAFDVGLLFSGLRGLNLARSVTFYRGTTSYDALEIVGNQAINA